MRVWQYCAITFQISEPSSVQLRMDQPGICYISMTVTHLGHACTREFCVGKWRAVLEFITKAACTVYNLQLIFVSA
jgi:hypothetical protein